jgi:post-segregation antitoxin (ccd killing protein)
MGQVRTNTNPADVHATVDRTVYALAKVNSLNISLILQDALVEELRHRALTHRLRGSDDQRQAFLRLISGI